jgi:hypothetical protein
MRLIDADELELGKFVEPRTEWHRGWNDALDAATTQAPDVNAVALPCKIGDDVWAIRTFYNTKHPQPGKVSEMYFTQDMELAIVVKYVARGKWGETVFATYDEALAAIEGRKDGK